MLSSIKKSVTIPPYWVNLLFGSAMLLIGIWLKHFTIIHNLRDSRLGGTNLILGVIIILLF